MNYLVWQIDWQILVVLSALLIALCLHMLYLVVVCSLIDLSLCSANLFASTFFQVRKILITVATSRSVNLRPPLQPGIILYKWPFICQELNATLQCLPNIYYNSFYELVFRAIHTYCSFRNSPSKGLPVYWTSRCSNILKQKNIFWRKFVSLCPSTSG